jgi:hypothetical protein
MKRKFEAHITCPRDASAIVEKFAGDSWKFSAIDGDPVMGKRPYCYLTAYDTDAGRLLDNMEQTAEKLRWEEVEILRQKVEEIIYDTKTNWNCMEQCCGHCGEP